MKEREVTGDTTRTCGPGKETEVDLCRINRQKDSGIL